MSNMRPGGEDAGWDDDSNSQHAIQLPWRHNGDYSSDPMLNQDDSSAIDLVNVRQRLDTSADGFKDASLTMVQSRAPPRPQKPKVVYSTRGYRAFVQFLIFQFPSIAVTTALLVLYICQVSWNPSADQLGALLFAAKVHESLIIASLFNMVCYHVHRGLLSRRGIPYGFLTAPFQLSSPLYLFTAEFWAGLGSISPHSALLMFLLITTSVLAALVGASSGVVMLPQIGWRSLPESMPQIWRSLSAQIPGIRGYAISPADAMYPLNINLSMVPERCLNKSADLLFTFNCPFADFIDGRAAIYTGLSSMANWDSSLNTRNLTILDTDVRSMTFGQSSDHGELAVATCPLACLGDILDSSQRSWLSDRNDPVKMVAELTDANGTTVPTKQPRVVTQCSDATSLVQNRDTETPYYEFRILRFFYPQFNFTVPKSVFEVALNGGAKFGFIDLNEYLLGAVTASVAVWKRNDEDGSDGEALDICLVDARWILSDAWILPFEAGSKMQYAATVEKNDTLTYTTLSPAELIRLDPSWCNALNATLYNPTIYSNASTSVTPHAASAFDLLELYTYNPTDDIDTWLLGAALTIFLTSALSRVPNSRAWILEWSVSGPWKPDPNTYSHDLPFSQLSDLKDYTLVSQGYYHNVYGYDFSQITTVLAWSVLLLHYLLVMVHLVVLVINRGWTSESWRRFGELVTLAMNSRPTDSLINTGAGVAGSGVWRLNASVREVAAEQRVEIVLRDENCPREVGPEEGYNLIKPDRKYS